MNNLTAEHLVRLVKSVFPRFPDDRYLGIMVDIPSKAEQDNKDWEKRRSMASEWYDLLKDRFGELGLHGVKLIAYPDVGSNNAELPAKAFFIEEKLPAVADDLGKIGRQVSFVEIFEQVQLFLAVTEYSTTAPLKNAAKKYGFRAATMPGFSADMIPALKIDYNTVNIRVRIIKDKLDKAESALIKFVVDSRDAYEMFFDLRHRTAHASSGRFPDKGTAGNLPSGEAYIVPYEGEKGEKSRTQGDLPVQIDNEVVLFQVEENRAVSVRGTGPAAARERDHLRREPAYGNMAELGFGVLGAFGLFPIGKILLDEKLGLHIAFGRSEHFGGRIGPEDFSSPEEVIHLDRIYIPETQPRIKVASLVLHMENGTQETIIQDDKYQIF